jgi:hypothetical protein
VNTMPSSSWHFDSCYSCEIDLLGPSCWLHIDPVLIFKFKCWSIRMYFLFILKRIIQLGRLKVVKKDNGKKGWKNSFKNYFKE